MKYYSMVSDIHNIDNNIIRLACTIQLKVLSIIMKNSDKSYTSEQIASELRKNISDVEESLEFWTNLNIIKINDISAKNNKEDLKNKSTIKKVKKEYIIERLENSDEIKYLLNEAEKIMGRPLSCSDINIFMSLKDVEGLPCNVILMLIQYCAKLGKASTRYIEKVGLDWARSDIDSVTKAEEKIKNLDYSRELWTKFEKIIGCTHRSPTAKEKEAISRWFIDWKFDENMIKEAYDRCVDNKGSYKLSYMDGIIKKWKKSNITTIDEVNRFPKYKTKSKPSYNLEEYASLSIFD